MNQTKAKVSLRKRIKFSIIISFISFLIFIFLAEIFLLIFNPQPYQYPTLKFSEKYKKIYHSNVTIKSYYPPETRYYSTNEMGFRKSSCNLSIDNDKTNIVLLGDSFTFGIGVNDGYEFGAIMGRKLEESFNVINLGIGGWGLTQEIRAFYEIGQSFNPEIAIVFFFSNDPYDNILDVVTRVNNGKFEFIDSNNASKGILSKISKSLSNSIIQKSNLYNFIRNTLYLKYYANAVGQINDQEVDLTEIPEDEKLYCNLIDVFANDLKQNNVKLMFVSINYLEGEKIESELNEFPFIKKYISELDSLGLIDYVEINNWFTPEDMVASPVSHFDTKWNFVLGENLADYILSYHSAK